MQRLPQVARTDGSGTLLNTREWATDAPDRVNFKTSDDGYLPGVLSSWTHPWIGDQDFGIGERGGTAYDSDILSPRTWWTMPEGTYNFILRGTFRRSDGQIWPPTSPVVDIGLVIDGSVVEYTSAVYDTEVQGIELNTLYPVRADQKIGIAFRLHAIIPLFSYVSFQMTASVRELSAFYVAPFVELAVEWHLYGASALEGDEPVAMTRRTFPHESEVAQSKMVLRDRTHHFVFDSEVTATAIDVRHSDGSPVVANGYLGLEYSYDGGTTWGQFDYNLPIDLSGNTGPVPYGWGWEAGTAIRFFYFWDGTAEGTEWISDVIIDLTLVGVGQDAFVDLNPLVWPIGWNVRAHIETLNPGATALVPLATQTEAYTVPYESVLTSGGWGAEDWNVNDEHFGDFAPGSDVWVNQGGGWRLVVSADYENFEYQARDSDGLVISSQVFPGMVCHPGDQFKVRVYSRYPVNSPSTMGLGFLDLTGTSPLADPDTPLALWQQGIDVELGIEGPYTNGSGLGTFGF